MYGVLKEGSATEIIAVFTAPLSIASKQPSFVSDSMSLKRRVGETFAQRWELEAGIAPSNDSAEFMVSTIVNGHTRKFEVLFPQVLVPVADRMPSNKDIRVANTQLAMSDHVDITGNGNSSFKPGHFIRFSGHPKVYMVVASDADGGGITIKPQLRSNIAANTQIYFGDRVKMLVRYDTDTHLGIKYVDGILADPGTVRFIEAV